MFVVTLAKSPALVLRVCVVLIILSQPKKNKELKRKIAELEREIKEIKNRRANPDV